MDTSHNGPCTVRSEGGCAMMPWNDEELRAALDALPNASKGPKAIEWSGVQNTMLLVYWPIKRQSDVAKVLGRPVGACREQFEKLTKET